MSTTNSSQLVVTDVNLFNRYESGVVGRLIALLSLNVLLTCTFITQALQLPAAAATTAQGALKKAPVGFDFAAGEKFGVFLFVVLPIILVYLRQRAVDRSIDLPGNSLTATLTVVFKATGFLLVAGGVLWLWVFWPPAQDVARNIPTFSEVRFASRLVVPALVALFVHVWYSRRLDDLGLNEYECLLAQPNVGGIFLGLLFVALAIPIGLLNLWCLEQLLPLPPQSLTPRMKTSYLAIAVISMASLCYYGWLWGTRLVAFSAPSQLPRPKAPTLPTGGWQPFDNQPVEPLRPLRRSKPLYGGIDWFTVSAPARFRGVTQASWILAITSMLPSICLVFRIDSDNSLVGQILLAGLGSTIAGILALVAYCSDLPQQQCQYDGSSLASRVLSWLAIIVFILAGLKALG